MKHSFEELQQERQALRETFFKLTDKPPETEHDRIVQRILQDKAWLHTKKIRRILSSLHLDTCSKCQSQNIDLYTPTDEEISHNGASCGIVCYDCGNNEVLGDNQT